MEITAKKLDSVQPHYFNDENFDEIKNELLKFQLTPNQIKVFFYLGKFGSKTANEISKNLDIPRTETYHLLTTLQSKGVILVSFEHPIRFSALQIQKAIFALIHAESERLHALKKSEPVLMKLWGKIPTASENFDDVQEERLQVLRGGNQINTKIIDMISNAKKEFLIFGCEKDLLKFYHANFLDTLKNQSIDYKILSSTNEKSLYIFDDVDKSKVKRLCSTVKENLCFLIKDNNEVLFFIKNASNNNREITAMWTNSETMIYSKLLLFKNTWSKSKSIPNKNLNQSKIISLE